MPKNYNGVARNKVFLFIFILGFVMRAVSFFCFYYLSDKDLNDMDEKLWIAISQYMAKGLNPYGQSYSMDVMDLHGDNANKESFFQYPPFILIAYTPTLIWPFSPSIGASDFMPAFAIIGFLASIFIFYRLYREGYRITAFFFWVVVAPFSSLLDYSTFIALPLLLLTVAIISREKPLLSALSIGLGVASYTYLAIPALFLLVYNWKRGKDRLQRFIIGLVPSIVIVLFFFFLNPATFVHDIFISQATNQPANFLYPYYSTPGVSNYWWMHIFSLPPYINTIYNSMIDPSVKLSMPYLTESLTIAAICFAIFLLFKLWRKCNERNLVLFSFLSLLALVLVSSKGFPHYVVYPLMLFGIYFEVRMKQSITRKETLIPVPSYVPCERNVEFPVVREYPLQSIQTLSSPSREKAFKSIKSDRKITMLLRMKIASYLNSTKHKRNPL
jgi:hypothetical protein